MAKKDVGKPLAYVVLFVCIGCLAWECQGEDTATSDNKHPNHVVAKPFPTEEQVSNIVKQGTERQAVIQAFGAPLSHDKTGTATAIDDYDSGPPQDSRPFKNKFSGFQVFYKDDRVVDWKPTYGDYIVGGANTKTLNSIRGSTNITGEIAFYVVDQDFRLKGGRFIDDPRFSNLGLIATNADLAVRQFESIELKAPDPNVENAEKEYSVAINLTKDDAKTFANLTSHNLLKPMLIMVNRRPISAPWIKAPINSGHMEIGNLNKKDADELMASFKQVVQ